MPLPACLGSRTRDAKIAIAAKFIRRFAYGSLSIVLVFCLGAISSTNPGGAADYVDRILKGEKPADLPV